MNYIIPLKDSIYALISELQLLTKECSDKSIMSTLKHSLHAAVSVVKILLSKKTNNEVSLTQMIQYAPNSNHEKQLTFRSTRKRRPLATNSISKPSQAQVLEQRKKLKEEDSVVFVFKKMIAVAVTQ